MLITNNPNEVGVWDEAGVNYTFVDLEYLGKEKRQGHLDTVFSKHSLQDITSVRPYDVSLNVAVSNSQKF